VANDAQAQLRQLEQKAESYKTIYHTYLQRDQEAAQQESFPLTDAHVITAASRPIDPSRPRKVLIISFSVLLGAVAGLGIAMLRESMDRVFRTVEQVRHELDCEVLGILPALPPEPGGPVTQKAAVDDPKPSAPILRYSIDHPFSTYAETLRSAKVAADVALHHRSTKIIGLVSLLPGEGKSTIAKNFASLLAVQGAKTLLIDADIRSRALTRLFRIKAEGDLAEEPSLATPNGLLEHESDSGLDFLPCIYTRDDRRAAAGFTSAALQSILHDLGRSYEPDGHGAVRAHGQEKTE
jgi:succinoglycan biosynthesis transport protein ExoP